MEKSASTISLEEKGADRVDPSTARSGYKVERLKAHKTGLDVPSSSR